MESTEIQINNRIIRINDCLDKKIVLFKNQNFETIKNSCLLNKSYFEDSIFPSEDTSLYLRKKTEENTNIVWKRPGELCENPCFFSERINVLNFSSGLLKKSSIINGCSALSLIPKLLDFTVPENQNFDSTNYCGIFHFRFWYYGKWIDVVIDDRIPVDSNNNFLFSHNKANKTEFWLPLLEKAYAKVCGCYESMATVSLRDLLVDFTGGFVETFDIKNQKNEKRKNEMWLFLNESLKHESLIFSYIEPNPKIRGVRLANGLALNCYYVVSRLISVSDGDEKIFNLIQIKNPFDEKIDWRLPWCEKVNSLMKNNDHVATLLNQQKSNEGQFWITFDDFYHYFETIVICEFTNDAYFMDQNSQRWNVFSYHGEWKFNETNIGFKQTDDEYWRNPQLFFKIVQSSSNEKINTVVSLYQKKYMREKILDGNSDNSEAFIQFRIYRIIDDNEAEEANKNCSRLYAKDMDKVISSGCYVNCSEVTRRLKLASGNYVIVPSCYDTRRAQFVLRVGTETPIEHDNSTILEEFKSILDKEDIYFPIENGQKSDKENQLVVEDYKFYTDYMSQRDNDLINSKKRNKYFD